MKTLIFKKHTGYFPGRATAKTPIWISQNAQYILFVIYFFPLLTLILLLPIAEFCTTGTYSTITVVLVHRVTQKAFKDGYVLQTAHMFFQNFIKLKIGITVQVFYFIGDTNS